MPLKVLLIFTSREGQTDKITQTMAEQLEALGHHVERRLLTANTAPMSDLSSFDWVVVGGSIHYGKHEAFLANFIQRHLSGLSQTQTAFFSVNLTARKADKNTPETNPYLNKFLSQVGWVPTRTQVFAGALLYSQYNWHDKLIIRFIMWLTKGNTDTSKDIDYTNWPSVKAFARSLVE
ncbi:menaquinone-dependent protoporphyrinogen IX dehydrogenase [Neiella marina]|uniref:Protoporphyrinogen IX dehydrogenase [quinone] n=1 Tax=Neiella holothuriorum TaxID=2870530 RepID=A0ABS7ELN8_9GAMM|nr:menaquinone-dependent protoporphyrinogen IX dehydrogenase [Neiella holothuriorum]MBW8192773.1 menaquinone-dependent protoporphyrinogen IX dehydrogenase [Neiella holothuriorum]